MSLKEFKVEFEGIRSKSLAIRSSSDLRNIEAQIRQLARRDPILRSTTFSESELRLDTLNLCNGKWSPITSISDLRQRHHIRVIRISTNQTGHDENDGNNESSRWQNVHEFTPPPPPQTSRKRSYESDMELKRNKKCTRLHSPRHKSKERGETETLLHCLEEYDRELETILQEYEQQRRQRSSSHRNNESVLEYCRFLEGDFEPFVEDRIVNPMLERFLRRFYTDFKDNVIENGDKDGEFYRELRKRTPIAALYEFCDRKNWGVPRFFDKPTAQGWLSVVTINGQDFDSGRAESKKKDARNAIAKEALKKYLGVDLYE